MISWYWFAIIAAVVSGIVFILQKKLLKIEHSAEYSLETNLIALMLALFFLPYVDFRSFNYSNIAWMFLVSIFTTIGFLFVAKSIRHSQISNVVPLVNFGPMFLALTAYIFLGEKLTGMQVAGVVMLVIGSYILQTNHNMKNVFEPLKNLVTSKYYVFILLGLLFYAFSGTIERYVLQARINPFEAIILLQLFVSVNFLVYELIKGKKVSEMFEGLKNNKMQYLIVAMLMLTHRTAGYYATKLTVAVALVSAIKRSGSFIATLFGGKFFHEDAILKKSLACLVLIAGAVMIILA
ncbi:EamA family transporter [Candidatus Woesearchaeota archaeon]|nr:MAG: EamA family transporter [Candidatus Woesearchaeota archaeon]